MNQKRSTEKQPKPLRILDDSALRHVAGGDSVGPTTGGAWPALDGKGKDAG